MIRSPAFLSSVFVFSSCWGRVLPWKLKQNPWSKWETWSLLMLLSLHFSSFCSLSLLCCLSLWAVPDASEITSWWSWIIAFILHLLHPSLFLLEAREIPQEVSKSHLFTAYIFTLMSPLLHCNTVPAALQSVPRVYRLWVRNQLDHYSKLSSEIFTCLWLWSNIMFIWKIAQINILTS